MSVIKLILKKKTNSINTNTNLIMSKKSSTNSTSKMNTTKDISKLKRDIQLIEIENFDFGRIVYSDPIDKQSPAGPYKSVRLSYMYDDQTIGPPIVSLGKKLAFGVQATNVDREGSVMLDNAGNPKELSGYKVPIVMTKKEPEKTELEEVEFFDALHSEIIRWAVENKQAIGKGKKKDATIEDNVSVLLYRRTAPDGSLDDSASPIMYTDMIYYKNDKKMETRFYGPGDKEVNPLLFSKKFLLEPNIKFDLINITNKTIKLKLRIYDATVEPITRAPVKRLAKKNTISEEVEELQEDDDFNEEVEEVQEDTGFESD